mmetsp:Transcript_8558/g.23866  ORF Transcript_8558/g.23866 Transcript_8558/m.23866 type:complete len:424 (+) Transcript_8558:871-2142(+)
MGLLLGIATCGILKLAEHIGDHGLDLVEGAAQVHLRGYLGSQEGQFGRAVLAGEAADDSNDLEIGPGGRGLCAPRLDEGELAQGGVPGDLLNGQLGPGDGAQLLAAALRLTLEVLGLCHALVVQVRESSHVGGQVLGSHREVALRSGLLLARGGLAFLGLGHLLVGELDLVLQALLHHLEGVQVLRLLFASRPQLTLGLVQEIREGLHNVPAVALVDGARWRAHVLVVGGGLHEGRQLADVGGAEHGALHEDLQGLHHVLCALELEHGGATLHLALEDADRALKGVDDLSELLLGGHEDLALLAADVCGSLEVGLVHGDLAGQLFDLGRHRADGRHLLVDGRLEPGHLGLASLDLVGQRLGALLAPLGVLAVDLLGLLALPDDFRLEVSQQLQSLADGRGRISERGRSKRGAGEDANNHLHCQ